MLSYGGCHLSEKIWWSTRRLLLRVCQTYRKHKSTSLREGSFRHLNAKDPSALGHKRTAPNSFKVAAMLLISTSLSNHLVVGRSNRSPYARTFLLQRPSNTQRFSIAKVNLNSWKYKFHVWAFRKWAITCSHTFKSFCNFKWSMTERMANTLDTALELTTRYYYYLLLPLTILLYMYPISYKEISKL